MVPELLITTGKKPINLLSRNVSSIVATPIYMCSSYPISLQDKEDHMEKNNKCVGKAYLDSSLFIYTIVWNSTYANKNETLVSLCTP